ncbi:MAG: chromate transporter [Alphaproteobacteria bacterium]
MILITLFLEFFKIGSLAIGGGMVTIPFLVSLSGRRGWFSLNELADIIAISESTPGPIGVNMATFVGYKTAGIWGGLIATSGLVIPSIIVMILLGKWLLKNQENQTLQNILFALRPAVLALIGYGGFLIAKVSIINLKSVLLFVAAFIILHFYKKHPILMIIVGAFAGVLLKL